jgi:hypothetical protein
MLTVMRLQLNYWENPGDLLDVLNSTIIQRSMIITRSRAHIHARTHSGRWACLFVGGCMCASVRTPYILLVIYSTPPVLVETTWS